MPLLLVICIINRSESQGKNIWTLAAFAFAFSFLGDLFLSDFLQEYSLFLFGLIAFLVTHILYILIFRKLGARIENLFKGYNAFASMGILVWASIVLYYLWPSLGSMGVAVAIYVLVIASMSISAFSLLSSTRQRPFFYLFAGAVLFMLSDMCIAIMKFSHEMAYGRFIVMSTYLAAQFLILKGLHTSDTSLRSQTE